MKMRESRLRRQDSIMLRVDNMRNNDIDALEPYKANKNVNRNPALLFDQKNYNSTEEKKKNGGRSTVILGVVVIISAVVIILLLLQLLL